MSNILMAPLPQGFYDLPLDHQDRILLDLSWDKSLAADEILALVKEEG